MDPGTLVRTAVESDIAGIARLHVESWRETYRGLMADEVLDDPGFLHRREVFWTAMITDPRHAQHRIKVAECDAELVGIAMAGPASDPDVRWPTQLYVLYTRASVHGFGVGAALLNAVITPGTPAGLWVADPHPRAQAFYRKQGFVADGSTQAEDGVREIRMVRS